MKDWFKQICKDDGGQDLIEYALVAAVISLVAITGIRSYAGMLANAFTYLGTSITSAV